MFSSGWDTLTNKSKETCGVKIVEFIASKNNVANYLGAVYKTTLVERVGLIRAGIPADYFYDTAPRNGSQSG